MRSRAVRVTLTLLAIAAVAAAGYFYWTTLARINAVTETAETFDDARATATRASLDLRAAHQAYVAAAQNETYWFEKATASASAVRSALPVMEASTNSGEARAALADVAAALDEFEQRDRRVRGYVSSGQKLLASDIIFSDGIEVTARILASLDRAGSAASRDARLARVEAVREQVIAAASAAGVALAVILLLVPLRADTSAVAASVEPAPVSRTSLDLDLRPEPRRVAPQDPAKPESSSPLSPKTVLQIEELARVCTDLARISDSATIPVMLERTAAALGASGIVLWVGDAERKALVPIAAHGYPANVLSRLGTLQADAENVTAAAFRTGLLQIVRSTGNGNGAIAAPLVSASGCLGVMAAEMRQSGEKEASRRAAASIVAAQLATMVGPPPAAQTEDRGSAVI